MRCLILVLVGFVCAAAGDLRENFEGETVPKGWKFFASRGKCSGRWDAENAFEKGHSLRISIAADSTARGHWRYLPKIALKPEANYCLRFRTLTLNAKGEVYAILYENGLEDPQHWHQLRSANGSHDWEEKKLYFRTGADASWGRLILKFRHGTGYAWFDDVVLEETNLSALELPQARQFPKDDGFPLQALWSPAQWTQQGILHLARGQLNPLSLFLKGVEKEMKSPALVIATSPGLKLEKYLFRGRGTADKTCVSVVDGGNRWRFPLSPALLQGILTPGRYRWDRYLHLGLEVAADAAGRGTLTWWFENDGEAGPKYELAVRTVELGAEIAPNPDFRILVQHTGVLRSPDVEFNRRMYRYLRLGAMEGGLAPSRYDLSLKSTDQALAKLGFTSHSWRFEGFQAPKTIGARAVNSKGEEMASRICPTAQLDLPSWRKYLHDYYEKCRDGEGMKRLIIDYEPPLGLCFCPLCRRAFAEEAKLDVETIVALPIAELRKRHGLAWNAFRARQHAAIVRLHIDIIRELSPGAEVGLCSWAATEDLALMGGDIRLFEPEASFHAPMIYCKELNYHDRVEETCSRTRIPVLPFIELSDISQPRHLTPDEFRLNLLATGLSGGKGAVLWVGAECLDAQYMAKLRQSLRELRGLFQQVPWQRGDTSWVTARPVVRLQRTLRVDGVVVPIDADERHLFLRPHIWGNDREAVVAVLNYDPKNDYDVQVAVDGKAFGTLRVPAGEIATRVVKRR